MKNSNYRPHVFYHQATFCTGSIQEFSRKFFALSDDIIPEDEGTKKGNVYLADFYCVKTGKIKRMPIARMKVSGNQSMDQIQDLKQLQVQYSFFLKIQKLR